MSLRDILFVTSEVHPFIKTGGLADVSGSLPVALRALRRDVRIVLPAYRAALQRARNTVEMTQFSVHGSDTPVTIREGRLPGTRVVVWFVDSPPHFDRPGGPYTDEEGRDWPDNAQRFTVFSRAVEKIACGEAGLAWRPELIHCNDWQSGLVPALLALRGERPATVFTIHNLAYQGLFSWDVFQTLHLPQTLWSMHAMEFYGQFSFIKGGIVFADMINTVSPNYAREITTPEFGCGLQDLLASRKDRLVGILNGADYSQWNPAKDPHLVKTYNAFTLEHKAANKAALQDRFHLPREPKTPLIGLIGRLVEQKGFDLLLAVLPQLLQRQVQVVVLGSGDKSLEDRLKRATVEYPRQVSAHIGYDESLAHLIEGGADMFLMPSRYEPCGLNQIYSLRYGTLPIVRRTGGLANTVIDATEENIANRTATGVVFDDATPQALLQAVDRALALYRQPRLWKKILFNGMQQDFSWRRSARQYLQLYQRALQIKD